MSETLVQQSDHLLSSLYLSKGDERSLAGRVGFSLVAAPSNVLGAGNGLFIRGGVMAGTLVAYFPGVVHLREHLRDPKAMDQFDEDPNFMILSRYDDCIIDSREHFGKADGGGVGSSGPARRTQACMHTRLLF